MPLSIADFGFVTARLRVRPAVADDRAIFCALYADAPTMRLIAPPLTPEQASRAFANLLRLQEASPLRVLVLAIVAAAGGQTLGFVGCQEFDANAARLEIGLILDRRAHGKGFPPEVLTGFVARLFALLPVETIEGRFPAANTAADRAVRGIGFELDHAAMAASNDTEVRIRAAHRRHWLAWRADSSP